MTTDLDQPIIAWDNLLPTATIAVTAGALSTDTPLDRLWDGDMLRPCRFTPDASGRVQLTITPTETISCVIAGGSRNDPGGYITGAASVRFDAISAVGFGAYPFGLYRFGDHYTESSTLVLGEPGSQLLRFMATCTSLVITFDGVSTELLLPQLFIGDAIEMPFIDLDYDPYTEVTGVASFEAESGREYSRIRYRRVELSPSWSYLDSALWGPLDAFREGAIELRQPFWFAWRPASAPGEVYLVKHTQPSAPMPYKSARHRALSLKLREVV